MNANAVARHYGRLSPEERFRLILAASGRGDETERDRLVNAGERIVLSMPDHSPYAHAFEELALLVFIELLEEAARYDDASQRASDAFDLLDIDDAEEEVDGEEDEGSDAEDDEPTTETSADEAEQRPAWQRFLELAYGAGFLLRTRAEGWKLFCERMNVPPFLLWEGLLGFDRLRRALIQAEQAAFRPDGFVDWLNRIRPAGEPPRTETPLTAEGIASATEDMFRQRVEWWGG